MAVLNFNLLSPLGHNQLKSLLEKIAVGGKIVILDSSGKVADVFKDKKGNGAWSNPIYMDSLGHATLEIWLPWQDYYDILFYDKNGDLIQGYYGISGVNDITQGGRVSISSSKQWIATDAILSQGPGYVILRGDFTDRITPFTRLRLITFVNFYGWATNITLETLDPRPTTRVEYALDKTIPVLGVVSSISYGLISQKNTSFPTYLGGAVNIKIGEDLTASSSIPIWSTDGNFHYILGSTPIDNFGNIIKTQVGAFKYLLFQDDCIINYDFLGLLKPIITPREENLEVLAGTIVQVFLRSEFETIVFPISTINEETNFLQPPINKNTILSGEIDYDSRPAILKTPIFRKISPVMTSNTSPSGFLSTASSSFDNSHQPWHAFDSAENQTPWSTLLDSSVNSFLQLKLDVIRKVRAYAITRRSDGDASWLSSWYLQGSNNGSTWDNLDYQKDWDLWPAGTTKTFYLNFNPQSYINYRIYILSVGLAGGNPANNYAQISNLALYEYENDLEFTTTDEESITPIYGTLGTSFQTTQEHPLNMTSDTAPVPYVASASRYFIPPPPPQQSNLISWSEDLSNMIWKYHKSHSEYLPDEITPIGVGAYKIFCDDYGGTSFDRSSTGQIISFKRNTWYNLSCYIKFPDSVKGQLNCYTPTNSTKPETGAYSIVETDGNTNTGITSPYWIVDSSKPKVVLPDGWYRANISVLTTVDGIIQAVGAGIGSNVISSINGVLITGIQLTEGTLLLPYEKTEGSIGYTEPFRAFDIDPLTGWLAGEFFIQGDWIKCDMGIPIEFNEYDVSATVDVDLGIYAPKSFILQGSNTDLDADWTDIDYQVDLDWGLENSTKTFTLLEKTEPYRYLRLYLMETTGPITP